FGCWRTVIGTDDELNAKAAKAAKGAAGTAGDGRRNATLTGGLAGGPSPAVPAALDLCAPGCLRVLSGLCVQSPCSSRRRYCRRWREFEALHSRAQSPGRASLDWVIWRSGDLLFYCVINRQSI